MQATKHTPHASPMSEAASEPILVGADRAAELLSISLRTLWTLTREGVIPHTRLRGRVLYSPRLLREWSESASQGGDR